MSTLDSLPALRGWGREGDRFMLTGHQFKRLRDRRGTRKKAVQSNTEALLEILSRHVVEPFARVTGMSALAIPLVPTTPEEIEDPPPNPGHPACAEYVDSDYCRESWQLHLAELENRPETHWHTCNYGRLCALVPIVHHDRCLAVVKLACLASMAKEEFEDHVELLDILAESFVISKADFLERLPRIEQGATALGLPPSYGDGRSFQQHPNHPQVARALQYVKEHLSDPKLSVSQVALVLDMHPDYLAHLFATEVGQRMIAYITGRRIELAKNLLATTHWQVKRVARESGYANPNWFYHVFKTHTGLAPGAYRRDARKR